MYVRPLYEITWVLVGKVRVDLRTTWVLTGTRFQVSNTNKPGLTHQVIIRPTVSPCVIESHKVELIMLMSFVTRRIK